MARLLYVCLLVNVLSLVAQLHPLAFVIGSDSLLFAVPMAPRHGTSMEHSCVCGAGFAQEQHLTRHKNSCSTSKEIAKRAFEKGLKHKHRPRAAKRQRTESRAGNASSSHPQSLSSRSQMSVDGGEPDDVQMGSEPNLEENDFDFPEAPPPSSSPVFDFDIDLPSESSSPPPPESAPEPAPKPSKRVRKPTAKRRQALEDVLPEGPGPIDMRPEPVPEPPQAVPPVRNIFLRLPRLVRTLANSFGVSRLYIYPPTRIPDMDIDLPGMVADVGDKTNSGRSEKTVNEIISPYPNTSSFRFANWFWNGGHKKSKIERGKLLNTLLAPDFDVEDLRGVNFDKIDMELANDPEGAEESDNGWSTSTLTIKVPVATKITKASRRKKANADRAAQVHDEVDTEVEATGGKKFAIPGFHHRGLMHILKSSIEGNSDQAKQYHWHPFEQYWQPPDADKPPERMYDELYSSPAFVKADRELQESPRDSGCDLPRAIAAIMLWSDATHVAQFGQAKLWPIYFYLGNLSKYARCKPSEHAGHQAAYLPTLPDNVQDFIRKFATGATDPLMAHCRRELFHEAWKVLLDKDFIHAYVHGVVMDCADGIKRRIYPRIFTYSADYPEKVLIATIRDKGGCPCPRCLIPKQYLPGLGTMSDTKLRTEQLRSDTTQRREKIIQARNFIYNKGYVVNSNNVDNLLKEESYVPTENAFSSRLGEVDDGFNFFTLLVVDLLHEFELGVWKALLTHLIRILHTQGEDTVMEFNDRFRQVPAFGRSTIRSFPHNVADLKKLAARDFEDILQCAIPCFEGLLPSPHNETVLDLLFISAYWHGLSKLRMHTDSSLEVLDIITIVFGQKLRDFAEETCKNFDTVETDKEYQARKRAEARRESHSGGDRDEESGTSSGKRSRRFNLTTPKLHFLGDYVSQIRALGTTDSFTSQVGELQHRIIKAWNERSSKNNAVPQIVNMDVRESTHRRMEADLRDRDNDTHLARSNVDALLSGNHHHIAKDESPATRHHVGDWLEEHHGDPAFKNFLPRLKAHILAQIRGIPFTGDEPIFEPEELDDIVLQNNYIYEHKTASFNYTTYNLQRDQDTLNPTGPALRRYIMIPSYEDANDNGSHPFWYARVLGVFHTNVYYRGSNKKRKFQFLMVRWFGEEPGWLGGARHLRLDKVGYVSDEDPEAFGFLDPSEVLRACHLIPAFAEGKTTSLLGPSIARDGKDGDWMNYYVMRFVDRDMMMRYLGLGVGHMNPAGFPGEADAISVVPEPRYVPAQTKTSNRSASTTSSRPGPMVVLDGAPALPSNTNSQGTSDGDTVDDGAEEVPSDAEGELENGDSENEEEEDDYNFMQYDY